MTVEEILNLGLDAFGEDRYEEALTHFRSIEDRSVEAQAFIPFSYMSLAEQVSLQASASDDREAVIRGQQRAVSMWDGAIRMALDFIRRHPEEQDFGSMNAGVIAVSFSNQHAIVALGLTFAHKITRTTATIEKHMLGSTVLWEEITDVEVDQYVSMYAPDGRDFHILGPDERTKRIAEEKKKIWQNAAQVASILTWLGREYDAYMVRAAVAGEMADCENGEKSMLLAGEWFIARAKKLARAALNDEHYKEWNDYHVATVGCFDQIAQKYSAILRKYRKKGAQPPLKRLFQQGEEIPYEELSATPSREQVSQDKGSAIKDWWEVFLTVFSQLTFMRVLPTIMFSSVMSIFMGGMINLFNPNSDTFAPVLGGIWLAITFILTMVRMYKDSDNIDRTNFGLYKVLMYALIPLFGIKFWVGLVIFLVLRFLSKKYE